MNAPRTRFGMSRFFVPWLLALLGILPVACFSSNSVQCPTGIVCPAGQKCALNQQACIRTDCGDGVRQPGEACDDGNLIDNDGCSSDCKSDESCGNGILDKGRGEVCDDGNNDPTDKCSADCKSDNTCGNGIIDVAKGEVCDDGNNRDGDNCSADCKSTEICGNGVTDRIKGEVCDDGNTVGGDGCSADCKSGERCGNGIPELAEECDQGSNNGQTKDCLLTCKRAVCGDGFVWQGHEECDGDPKCNPTCKRDQHGDGIVNPNNGEECDPGSAGETAKCTKDGKVSFCGDGYTNHAALEDCDDGNGDSCGTCNATCNTVQFAPAKGTITITGNALPKNNDWLCLRSGEEQVCFQFKIGGSLVNPPPQTISLEMSDTATKVADKISTAISTHQFHNPTTRIKVEKSIPGTDVVLTLTQDKNGTFGNRPLFTTVLAQGFVVEGMSQGQGHLCAEKIGCTTDDVCDSGHCKFGSDGRKQCSPP